MPEAWQRGIILPIPKKRTRGPPDPNLHRGISLLSAVYKVFCTVMKNRVEAYVEGKICYVRSRMVFGKEGDVLII